MRRVGERIAAKQTSAEADTEAAHYLLRRDRANRRNPIITCGDRAVVEFIQQRHLLL